ncbi:MAG: hypothetical protein R3240_08020, partial [Gammaproteobacteria bacterium]|nr:hypothetical protein [Gammaproteobacteria bacterium]
LFALGVYSSAFAGWQDDAKSLFEKDEYHKVIDIVDKHKKDDDSRFGMMLLAFSHLQLYEFNDTRSDKKAFKNYMDQLEDLVDAKNLNDIKYFISRVDKPEVVDEARDLLKKAFKNISRIEQAPLVLDFLSAKDEKTRKLAASALEDMISSKRKYVKKGGTLREKDVKIMRDEKLIRGLLENIEISDAFHTLEDIEQPVLQYLNQYEGKKIIKLEEKINKAIAKRIKKHPDSNWYSANGTVRQAADE